MIPILSNYNFFNYQVPLVSLCLVMDLMILGFSVMILNGSCLHWRYRFEENFAFNNFVMHISESDKHWTLIDSNQLMGYRDAHWYIKDIWIGFSAS